MSVSGISPGVQRLIFFMDGAYLLTDYQSTYRFTLPTTRWKDGSHGLSVEALMRNGFMTRRASGIRQIQEWGHSRSGKP